MATTDPQPQGQGHTIKKKKSCGDYVTLSFCFCMDSFYGTPPEGAH